jgi:hypothetical protein
LIDGKKYLPKYFSLNTCDRNVSITTPSCDSCRVLGQMPHDRAAIARCATDYFFRMSSAHERHPASAVASADESRYIKKKKWWRRPGSQPEWSC